MTISLPPTAPSRQDPATFSDRADAFASWLVSAVPQFNDLAVGSIDSGNFQNITVSGQITGNAVTQSPTDTTSGRLLKVGDGGLLASNSVSINFDQSSASDIHTGFHGIADVASRPTGNFASAMRAKGSTSRGFDLAVETTTGETYKAFFRPFYGSGDIGDWQEFYHTGNIVGTVSQSGGDPTGAVLERDSNDDGEYTRYADGTQLCWRRFTIEESSSQRLTTDVSLPATFASTNQMVAQLNVPVHSASEFNGINRQDLRQWGTSAPGGSGTFSTSTISTSVFTVDGAVSSGATIANMQLTVKGRWF